MDDKDESTSWIPFLEEDDPLPGQICPYATTSQASIKKMLEIAEIKPDDILLDLGTGDGRIVLYAAKHFGIRGIGLDINPDLIQKANEQAKIDKVEHLVSFQVRNFAEESFDYTLKCIDSSIESKHVYPTIIACYLIPKALKIIEPRLKEIVRTKGPETQERDIRMVSIIFSFERWSYSNRDPSLNIFLYNQSSVDFTPKERNLDTSNPIFI
ncbi:hypothetical protein DLAC_05083 [Tieghemostelium lacteum]|uniref:Methyltransferase domain-containing protein n=1 Tax=Tieghemostelium lacteum TaxID=361077 RepID=A0A151ZIF5_TIELA|nr:hypothetical protein DLAC_05083 [Tieghemostelium lacteum]|eukprot:KYQ93695.1 hypothetical protein DLAC_05083 [Tieghemostelium lacteum]